MWVGWFFLNVPIILCTFPFPSMAAQTLGKQSMLTTPTLVMDLLDYIWPASFYEPVGSPLHFAFQTKEWYIQKYNDPIVQWSVETAAGHDSWMGLFMHLEAYFLLPTVLYGIYRLVVQRRGTSGCDELLFLVYALEVAFTTLICIYDTGFLDESVYSPEIKHELQYQVYAAWAVLRKSTAFTWGILPSDFGASHTRSHRHGFPHPGPHQGRGCCADGEEVAIVVCHEPRRRPQATNQNARNMETCIEGAQKPAHAVSPNMQHTN